MKTLNCNLAAGLLSAPGYPSAGATDLSAECEFAFRRIVEFCWLLADAIGQAAGKSSAAYQALFAISKGFAIAQASLNLQTAISNAMAIPWPANIPAIAQALSAGTQIVSAISGINYSGARYNGGPVSAGGLYQVGEKGKPEIYQPAPASST